ncbi:uncharacterized protein CEXT_161921 [Caerostris extrusa]|uniref:Uncharacterized protein n=1 Tax=Caerostris extrusa TaxID=172846 RepID=A0AAV4NTW7_CAEEX|nr:uncharacterized protein CEXT_161921 [Caerostris extrusa]
MLTPNPINERGFMNFCPKFPTRSGTDFQRQIVLHCELIPVNLKQELYERFMYCIPIDTGLHLQNSALAEILKKTAIAEEEEGEKNYSENLFFAKQDLKNSEISKATKSLLNELTRFNEYQIEMCRNINNVRLRINYYNEDREEDALERKDIILTILTTFEKYFDSMKEESEISIDLKDCLPRFEEFCLHRDYFDKIDFSSAIMFFDNLFLLKERLELPEKVYLEIESKFFLFIFCRKYLERYDQQTNFQGASRWITFQERLALKEQVCIFKKILEETEISKNNVVQSLPESQVRTLINMPQIYGQFVLVRLETYLNIATEVPVRDVKSILIIERCLIVIGECFKETDFKSIQMILPLALPKEFVSISKQIRNTVAHLKDYEIPFRNIAGQDVELFVKIQNDLLEFKNLISPIVLAHRYQMNQFLFLHSAKSVCKARKKSNLKIHEPIMKAILPPPEKKRNEICERSSDLQKQWKNYFNIMNDSLKKEIELLNQQNKITDKCTNTNTVVTSINADGSSISENIPNVNLTEHSTGKNIPENVRNDVSGVCNEKCPILSAVTVDQHNPMITFIDSGVPFTTDTNIGIFANKKQENMSMDENTQKSLKKKINFVDKEVNTECIENLNFDILIDDDDTCDDIPESEAYTETQCCGMNEEDSQLASDISVDRDWLVASVFNTSEDSVISNERESSEEMTRNMNALIGNSRMILEKYKTITDDMFQKFPGKKEDLDFCFENINKYCMILKGRKFLNQKEKDTILQSIPDKYKNTSSVKERLKTLLENATALTEEIESELLKLTLKKM